MADPLTLALIGAGLGVLKSENIDKPRAAAQSRLAAQTTRFSPFTGLRGQLPQPADPFGTALQFGATGLQLGQNLERTNAFTELLKQRSQQEKTVIPEAQAPRGIDTDEQLLELSRGFSPFTAIRGSNTPTGSF